MLYTSIYDTLERAKLQIWKQISGWQGLGMREGSCDYKSIAWVIEQFCDWLVPLQLHE